MISRTVPLNYAVPFHNQLEKMIAIRLLIGLALVTCTEIALAAQHPLITQWRVGNSTFEVNPETGIHKLKFDHGYGENNYALSLWSNGCRTTLGEEIIDLPSAGIEMRELNTQGSDTFDYTTSVEFSFNQNIVNSTFRNNLFDDPSSEKVQIRFCAVFDNKSNSGIVVNFDQLDITMTIELIGDFTVAEIELANRVITQYELGSVGALDGLSYNVVGRLCTETGPNISQGQGIAICICTSDFPAVRVTGVKSLKYTYELIEPDEIIVEGSDHFFAEVGKPFENGDGESCIKVTMFPTEYFFRITVDSVKVIMTGIVDLEFTTRDVSRALIRHSRQTPLCVGRRFLQYR